VFRNTSWLDAITTLSAVAAITNKIKVGTSILNIIVRNPVVCAKALTGIDSGPQEDYLQGLVLVPTKETMMFVELLLRIGGKDLMKHYKFSSYFGSKKMKMRKIYY
jgi:Luciferase-like monooxygenase